ncbi:hypothetical protein DSM14862_00856 [Sulfitobacter indolifex]|nr:hypothetical protein DSM14862_00856 [Sulfitobacter indolifex]
MLQRMGGEGFLLTDVLIASGPQIGRPDNERRLEIDNFRLPLRLSRGTDVEELRRAIGRGSAAFENASGNGGYPHKKIAFRFQIDAPSHWSVGQLARALSTPPAQAPTSDPSELQRRVRRALARVRVEERLGNSPPPPGQSTVPKSSATSQRYLRDPQVIAWVLEKAIGHCEACKGPAPFKRPNGEPFLEVHHVRPLNEGGPDTIDNAAACCPNCHRNLHSGKDRQALREKLIKTVPRLKDYPAVP